jgi:calcineurin-like phosphoesterase family protein
VVGGNEKRVTSLHNIWMVSDCHFMHKNILKFCPNTRLGADHEEMTELLIQNWNKQVAPDDEVWNLGDVFFCKFEKSMEIMGRLNGKINLILGNHDQVIEKNPALMGMFHSVQHYKKMRIGSRTVIMHHYPYLEWEQCHHGAYALFGHVHGSMDRNPHCLKYRTMDVGVDSRPGGVVQADGPMTLWNWEQIDEILGKREILSHH